MTDHTTSSVIPPSHLWRTLENSAGHILPHLQPDMKVLDVGCGLGVMTVDFAARLTSGHATGVDMNSDPLEKGRIYAGERGVTNIDFILGDATALPFPDNSFDITHTHQVLQHAPDPVQVLREMLRVTKPGGFVGARETDFATSVWYPAITGLDAWKDIYMRVARARQGEPEAGRRLHVWARNAGFDPARITCSTGTWCLASPDERKLWSELWAGQFLMPHIADVATKHGIASPEECQAISSAWKEWGAHEDAWCAVLSGVILYSK